MVYTELYLYIVMARLHIHMDSKFAVHILCRYIL
jgi:hypothetical protein